MYFALVDSEEVASDHVLSHNSHTRTSKRTRTYLPCATTALTYRDYNLPSLDPLPPHARSLTTRIPADYKCMLLLNTVPSSSDIAMGTGFFAWYASASSATATQFKILRA